MSVRENGGIVTLQAAIGNLPYMLEHLLLRSLLLQHTVGLERQTATRSNRIVSNYQLIALLGQGRFDAHKNGNVIVLPVHCLVTVFVCLFVSCLLVIQGFRLRNFAVRYLCTLTPIASHVIQAIKTQLVRQMPPRLKSACVNCQF